MSHAANQQPEIAPEPPPSPAKDPERLTWMDMLARVTERIVPDALAYLRSLGIPIGTVCHAARHSIREFKTLHITYKIGTLTRLSLRVARRPFSRPPR